MDARRNVKALIKSESHCVQSGWFLTYWMTAIASLQKRHSLFGAKVISS